MLNFLGIVVFRTRFNWFPTCVVVWAPPAPAGWGLCPIHLVFVCTADRTRTVPWTLKIVYYSLLETKSNLSKVFCHIYQNWEYYRPQNTNLNILERSTVLANFCTRLRRLGLDPVYIKILIFSRLSIFCLEYLIELTWFHRSWWKQGHNQNTGKSWLFRGWQ